MPSNVCTCVYHVNINYLISAVHRCITDFPKDHLHLLASTVSSKFLATLAATHPRLTFTETLTGFKHMGNVSDRLRREGDTVIFAFEEAIGFMCGDAVLDKVGGALQNIYRVCLVVSCIIVCIFTALLY